MRPEKYRCPSFSWASVDGCINTADTTDEGILITVQDICTTYLTEDKTGVVENGYLTVQGTLKALKLTRIADGLTWRMIVNGTEVKQGEGRPWDQVGPLVDLDIDQPDFEVENNAAWLYCLPARKPMGGYNTFFICLILESLGDGAYRRIDRAKTSRPHEIDILEASNENEDQIPCESYDPVSRKHTFRFI